ncbi:XK- protein 6 [Blomia tropicalis]|nr:XK- protein 6 [Blomia tropicalis]
MTIVDADLHSESARENDSDCSKQDEKYFKSSCKNKMNLTFEGDNSTELNDNNISYKPECCDKPEDDEDWEEERHKLQTQQSCLSANHRTQNHSFRLTHRSSLLSTHIIDAIDGNDDTDALPNYMSFTYLDAMALMFSVGTYFFDIITDIMVSTIHYRNQNYWYFALTIGFIAIPTFVMTCINLRWYIVDSQEPSSPKVTKWQWSLRVLCLLLQFGPVMRYIDSIIFGFKFRKFEESHGKKSRIARRHFQYMIYEDTDATMLRLFECFLEAAPQLVLQIYIIAVSNRSYIDSDWTVIAQIVSVNASLISLSWSLVSYLRILRMSLPNKVNMNWPGTIIQFHWRLFMIASRVLALALFASIYTYYIGIVCTIHWFVMFLWIVSMKTNFCNNLLEELFYNAVLAGIYYLKLHPTNNIRLFTTEFDDGTVNVENADPVNINSISNTLERLNINNGSRPSSANSSPYNAQAMKYLRQFSGVWTTQNRLLHPRPIIPTI